MLGTIVTQKSCAGTKTFVKAALTHSTPYKFLLHFELFQKRQGKNSVFRIIMNMHSYKVIKHKKNMNRRKSK
jgi:hypothetical protein